LCSTPPSPRFTRSDRRVPGSHALFLIAVAATFLVSLYPRLAQWREWTSHPDRYFSRGVPVASTDSYHWFRLAEEIHRGVDTRGRDRLRAYPEGVETARPPLISRLMALLAGWSGAGVHRAGMLLCALLSSSFVLPLSIYFHRIGVPLAGILGGVIGSLSPAYLQRTSIHRVDTDGGNLFFVWLIPLGIAGVAPTRRLRTNLAVSAGTGLVLAAFCAWYERPAFVPVFGATFAAHLMASRFPPRAVLLLTATLLLCANPWNLLQGLAVLAAVLRDYVLPATGAVAVGSGSALAFPSVYAEVHELQRASPATSLARLLASPTLAAIGLAGFAAFGLRHPRSLIPLLPALALGALGLLRSMRFLMYLSPFVGIGWGFLLTGLVGAAGRAVARLRRGATGGPSIPTTPRALREAPVYAAGLLFSALILDQTAWSTASRPRIGVDLIASLQALAERAPPDAAVAHTWGHGYLVTAVTGLATFNDGEDPDPVVEQLIDRGITSSDPRELYDIVAFLASQGRSGVDRVLAETGSYAALLDRIARARSPLPDPLIVLFTEKMTHEFSLFSRKGRWDFENARGPDDRYEFRSCRRSQDGRFVCAAGTGGRPVWKFLRVREGAVVEERSEPIEEGVVLQLVELTADSASLLVVDPVVYASNFNQMLVLGRHDPELFEPIHDDFPVARAWRLRPRGPTADHSR
jgi:dolichyl-diphosphooligosaccharide--protein glycosyltransferase